MKRLKILVLALVLSLSCISTTYASDTIQETYDLVQINQNENVFKNYVDGYSIEIPSSSTISFDPDQKRTQFNYGDKNVRIYIEEFDKDFSYEDYEYYTLKGLLSNQVDHNFTFNESVNTKLGKARVVEFNRRKLRAIENDQNNYLVFISRLVDGRALSVMVKSENPINRQEMISRIETFKTNVPVSKTPYLHKSKDLILDENNQQNINWADSTKELYVEDFIKSKDTTWGIFVHDFWRYNTVPLLEANANTKFKYLVLYHSFNDPNQNIRNGLKYAKENNQYLEFTLQTDIQEGKNLIYEVLEGKHDNFLNEMGQIFKENAHPTIFRLANEMNGDWCSYSAWNTGLDSDIYLAFYNYVYDIMEKQGANPYLIYVFNPNGQSFPNFKYNQESMYRPLDDRFQITGLTLYNTGTYYPDEKWQSFDTLYGPLYDHVVERYNKPLMITEFACSSIGGNKPAWTRDMLNQLEKYDRIKVAIWFNGVDRDIDGTPARIYTIDDPKENIEEFYNYFASKKKMGLPSESLEKILNFFLSSKK